LADRRYYTRAGALTSSAHAVLLASLTRSLY
jgi:hypothetical protein